MMRSLAYEMKNSEVNGGAQPAVSFLDETRMLVLPMIAIEQK